MAQMIDTLIGQTVSHYTIQGFIGQGGMGSVYQATDTRLHRQVALKFLPESLLRDPQAKERFIREAQAASALDHPNICTIFAIDETPAGQVFICMASYAGETLEEKLHEGPLAVEEAVDILLQVADGLAEAHRHGILHRDIKPGNIFLTANGEVKILDFGLAKFAGGPEVTQAGAVVGTPSYMAPEQHLAGAMDARTDIWAAGVLLYEMLTGKHPFRQPYEQATIYNILQNTPEPPTLYDPAIPPVLSECISTCLEKDPALRFASMADLQERLNGWLTGDATPAETPVPAPSRRFPPVSRRLAIAALMILAGALAAFFLWEGNTGVRDVSQTMAPAIPAKKNLVILPFNVIGDNPRDQAFCDGLNEILVNRLTRVEPDANNLLVIPTSEVLHQDIRTVEAARKRFGINLALTGSFQRMGDVVRITQNLVDARSLRQIRTTEVTARVSDLFQLKDGLYTRALALLQIRSSAPVPATREAGITPIPGAHEFYLQGRGYLLRYENEANITTAIGLFEQAIRLDSTFALGYAALGEAYWRRYDVTKDVRWTKPALSYCSRALDLNPELAPAYITLGMVHNGQGQSDQALQALRTALKISPGDPTALGVLARVYETQGQTAEAEQAFQEAIERRPDYWAGYNDLGIFYFKQGRLQDALTQFQQVVHLTPDNAVGYRNSGAVYANQQHWDEAILAFRKSLAIHPSYPALANLGTSYFYKQDYPQAVAYFQKALALQDTDYRIWGFLADAYYWGVDQQAAMPYYHGAIQRAEERLQINPNDQEVLADLAAYYSMVRENDQAVSILARLEKMPLTDVQIMARVGTTYEMLHQRDQALYWIERAISQGYTLAENQATTSLKQLVRDERYQKYLTATN